MRSKLFSFTFAIVLGLVTPVVSAIVFPDVVIAQTVEEKKKEAERLLKQGVQQFNAKEFQAAIQSWQQALKFYRSIGNRQGEKVALGNLGNLYQFLDEYPKAVEAYEESLVIARELNDRITEMEVLGSVGVIYKDFKNYVKATEFQEKSLLISREIQNRMGEGNALGNLGTIYRRLGNYTKAIEYQEKRLAIAREIQDRRGEGNALGNLGNAYRNLSNYIKAIEYQEKDLFIRRELKDRRGEGESLGNLGRTYQSLGNYSKAIEYYEQSISIARDTKNKKGERLALANLGSVYQSLDNYQKAIEYYEQGLAIMRAIQDRRGEGDALGDLGTVYKYLSNYDKSIEYQEQSLIIAREIKDREGESKALRNLGVTYRSLGNYSKAIQYHEQSLIITRELKNRFDEAQDLGNLGSAYQDFGNYSKAVEYHEKSLSIDQELKARFAEGQSLGNLGTNYLLSGNFTKAIELFQKRLAIAKEFRYRPGEATALLNLGTAYYGLSSKQYPLEEFRAWRLACSISGKTLNCKTHKDLDDLSLKAIDYWTKSLAISRQIQNRELERSNSINLGRLLPYHDIELAIAFYKQSINISESIRQKNQNLNSELQASYKETVAEDYRFLADLLLRENRIVEALQVLDLLKAQDLQDFIKDDKNIDRTRKEIKLFPQEELILTEFNNSSSDLNTFLKLSSVQTQTQYLRANAASQNIQLNAYKDLRKSISKLGKNVALFYPLILENRLELVILTNDRPPIHKPVPITRKQLAIEVESFRNQLQNRSRLIKEPAQKLYQSFIQPIEAELKAAGVDTIVYAPDDIMRYVPLAALHDGKQWLAERYQINYLTALALTPLEPDPNKTPKVLAAALTEAHQIKVLGQTVTFPALQFTQPEIETLAKTIPNTTSLINQSFSRQNLTTGIPNHTILHLATHGMFVPNSPDQSIIVMGDGSTISLREIEQQWKLPNVSLVVLSACETAIGGKLGNGIEILGFGYQMQRIGSRASISSLWTIDDGGTQGFMNTFYTGLKQGKTPAFAIQQTQKDIEQLRGAVRYVKGGIPTDLTHPFYWAPFILVGNGL